MKSTRKSKRRPLAEAPPPNANHAYQAEKHLRKFCAVTSHELGNVMGAIVGELDFALTATDTEVRNRAMKVALEAAERALNLARNLRYFAVHTRLDTQPSDVSQTLLDALDLVERDLETQRIRLAVFVEACSYAHIDPAAFQQIVLNLVAHAAHSMPHGGKLTVSLRQLPNQLQITLSDTGVGIGPAETEHLFEPYFLSKKEDGPSDNLGLGLSVAKALVEAHGGDISVESKEGAGTTFVLHFPSDPHIPRPSPYAEKRRFRRVSVNFPVEMETREGYWRTELVTLSTGGGFVLVPDERDTPPPELNSTVKLRLFFYRDQAIEIPVARVANLCRIGANAGLGLEFLEIDAKAKKLLSAIVRSHSS